MALNVLAHVDEEGLNPKDYTVPSAPPVERDILLTGAVLSYARDVRQGHAEWKSLDSDVELPAAPFDSATELSGALAHKDLGHYLANLPPPRTEYAQLKAALRFYRKVSDSGGWAMLLPGSAADFDDGTAGARMLRRRLGYEDQILASDPAADLTEALIRFQTRHGLEPDGRVGKRTLAELNISSAQRAAQIAANMERWRWLPRTFENSFIAINVPDAHLALTMGGRQVLDSRVVVGRPHDPTPILRAEGAGVTVNPPWNVPTAIARKEILPKLKANPGYLLSQDMILVNGPPGDPYGLHVDWHALPRGIFPYRIQQHPGPKNALGIVKIELPNRFDVYLHDTPAKSVFARNERDVSHGCVRVEQIMPLASYALAASLDAVSQIGDAVSVGDTKTFPLRQRLPIYFLYWTAFGGADGQFQFRQDIYGRDQRLIAVLGQAGPLRVSADLPKCQRS